MAEAGKKKILLVEDDTLSAAIESAQLEGEGYRVTRVRSGEDAIALINEKKISVNLILMDVDLGEGMDGTEAAQEILRTHDIPVVFLSSHTERAIVQKTEKITSYGYVMKSSPSVVLGASLKMAFKLFEARQILLATDESLSKSEARYRGLVENTNDVVYSFSTLRGTLYWSPKIKEILGYSVKILKDNPRLWYDSIHSDDIEAVNDHLGSLAGGKRSRIEYRVRDLFGKWHWLYDQSLCRPGEEGELLVDGTLSDITERKTAEMELQKVSNELYYIFKNMYNAFIVWESVFDENGRYVSFRFGRFNDAYARISGLKMEDVLGKNVFEVWPETEQSWVEVYGSVAVTGKAGSFEMYHKPTKGWYHCNAYRPSDSPMQVCVIFEDITERRRKEEQAN